MPTTTTRGLRVPLADGTDLATTHTHLNNLGQDLDAEFITVANFAALPAASKVGRRAVTLDTNFCYLDTGSAWLAQNIPLVTTLPASSSPVGTVVDLQTATMAIYAIIWRMRHMGSGEWHFVGGSNWQIGGTTPGSITSQSFGNQDLTSTSLAMPYGGEYYVYGDIGFDNNDTSEEIQLHAKSSGYAMLARGTTKGGGPAGPGGEPYNAIRGGRSGNILISAGNIMLALRKSGTNLFKSYYRPYMYVRPVYLLN